MDTQDASTARTSNAAFINELRSQHHPEHDDDPEDGLEIFIKRNKKASAGEEGTSIL
jgi:hypothetical protein